MLDQLLKLWAEQEERCRKVNESLWWIGLGKRHETIDTATLEPRDLAHLEYALREAIQARGWSYEIKTLPTGSPTSTRVEISSIDWDGPDGEGVYNKEPAIALLRAYLMALGCDLESVEVG